jgi:hypothetical protein
MRKTILSILLILPLGLPAKNFHTDFAKMLIGHWTTNDGYQKGSAGEGSRSDFYYDGNQFIDFEMGSANVPAKYSISILDEKKRMVKVTTYDSSGKPSVDEALIFSANGKKITQYFIEWDTQKIDYSSVQKWKYVNGKTNP